MSNLNKPYLRSVEILWDKIENKEVFPFSLPSIKSINSIEFTTPVTYIIGENGAGKSTLIEAIAVSMGLNPEGGTQNSRFSTEDTNSTLHKYLRTVKGTHRPKQWYFLRAESFYNVATYMQNVGGAPMASYGLESLHKVSHGESFMALLQNKLHGTRGFYIFDEPEAALSPNRQLTALAEIDRLVRQGSQLIITTHSPILMAYPNSTIYELTPEGSNKVSYEETEHYRITKDFLLRKDSMLNELLDLDE